MNNISQTSILSQSLMISNSVEEESDVAVLPEKTITKPPSPYAVVLYNDDYTPMEFVIDILQNYFYLDIEKATSIMLSVHHQGKGIAGIYPKDIAETKANQVIQHARVQGHPLMCRIESQE